MQRDRSVTEAGIRLARLREITLRHHLNCGVAFEADVSALHDAPSANDGCYDGCDVSLSVTRQHVNWNADTRRWEPATTIYQLSVDEARALVTQLQEAIDHVE